MSDDQDDIALIFRDASASTAAITLQEVKARAARNSQIELMDLDSAAVASLDPLSRRNHDHEGDHDIKELDIVQQQPPLTQNARSRTPRHVLWVAAGLILFAAGIAIIRDEPTEPSESTEPVRTESTDDISQSEPQTPAVEDPEVFLRTLVESMNQYDAVAVEEMIADDALISNVPNASRTELTSLIEFYQVLEWRWMVTECSASGRQATCQYDAANSISDALGLDPTDSGQLRLVIEDGRVVVFQNWLSMSDFWVPVVSEFRSWVERNHPDAADTMWPSDRSSPSYSGESVELFRSLSREFSAAQ